MAMALGSSRAINGGFPSFHSNSPSSPTSASTWISACYGSTPATVSSQRRRIFIFGSSFAAAVNFLGIFRGSIGIRFPVDSAIALEQLKKQSKKGEDELEDEEERTVCLFQETSPSVVYIKDIELPKNLKSSSGEASDLEDGNAKVEGTGSGFVWDKFGHIVTNYHVIAKLATDQSGLQCCKVSLVDAKGNSFSREGKIVGLDPDNDLAVLKVETEGYELKPVVLGTSHDLRVGQSCFAIGNPYGYENTLTTGVVSGLGREIPSPNGKSIREAIQTDTDINSGNSGGPLLDSHGRVIGVNTATFTRKGTGMSSGVNFAIPIDTVVRTVPYLIVYGTPYRDRF
ncbi:PREDICTED: protease Do-like 5, chloroplastic isoform X2 [Tarenaya hassleriana]|uniref:protease Do-like 5, chloroplastic isoform X2 n=1 Tax=Tarenaya hassleriana TaxID=28532 RepID=UPI00053CA360|nr:PREDICTED: protease Do-like 5, chloroplastic isoform X2 [Tarenaya hassleriana]